jgi:hypothetical protein
LAPIILFTYNRFHHAIETLKALKNNELAEASEVLVYSDGPKTLEDQIPIEQIRSYLKTLGGFKSLTLIERRRNLGLERSIITGVTEVLNSYGKAIVLEDDLVTSKFFLRFMNEGLLRDPGCWGWATWKRGWRMFNENGQALLDALLKMGLIRQFNYNNFYPYSKILENSILDNNASWAIRWYATAFLGNYLTLYPRMSLVHNIGNDRSGVHSRRSKAYDVELSDKPIKITKIPLTENEEARSAFEAYFRSLRRPIAQRVFGFLAKLKGRHYKSHKQNVP